MTLIESLQKTFQPAQPKNSTVVVVGTVAFDSIETPFGKSDRIIGGAATYISLAASYFVKNINLVSVVGGDFPKKTACADERAWNTNGGFADTRK